jgi:hypothetical protein
MQRPLLVLSTLLGVAGLHAQTPAAPPAANYDSLLKNSPFAAGASGPGAQASPVANPLELRGVFVDQGQPYFSLYEVATRTSRWVGMSEPGNPFTVKSYDVAKAEVKVEYQGREIVLGLKQAKVVAMAVPPPVPVAVGPAGAGPASVPTNVQPAQGDEATRLAQIAEEIRRRRALRQQAAQPAQQNPPK